MECDAIDACDAKPVLSRSSDTSDRRDSDARQRILAVFVFNRKRATGTDSPATLDPRSGADGSRSGDVGSCLLSLSLLNPGMGYCGMPELKFKRFLVFALRQDEERPGIMGDADTLEAAHQIQMQVLQTKDWVAAQVWDSATEPWPFSKSSPLPAISAS